MPSGRIQLGPTEKKILFNCYLDPQEKMRIALICFRRAMRGCKFYSEGQFIREKISSTKLPPPPTDEHVEAYCQKFPKQREEIMRLWREMKE